MNSILSKRIISAILSVLMVMSFIAMPALADEDEYFEIEEPMDEYGFEEVFIELTGDDGSAPEYDFSWDEGVYNDSLPEDTVSGGEFIDDALLAQSTYVIGKNVTVPSAAVPFDGANPYCDCGLTVGTGRHVCCWAYAAGVYKAVWGTNFTSFYSGDDYLRDLSASEKLLTAENLSKYLKDAPAGAVLRVDADPADNTADNNGHTFVLVEYEDASSALFAEGNYDNLGHSRLIHYSFSVLASGFTKMGYNYIKYIKFPNAPKYSANTHTHSYTTTSEIVPATCTEQGYTIKACSCGLTTKTDYKPALGHSYTNSVVTKQPTCTVTGVRSYSCSRCGKQVTEVIPVIEHSYTIPYSTVAATCTEAGQIIKACSCGQTKVTGTIPALGHDYSVKKVTKQATCSTEGVRTISCSRCSVSYTEVIPMSEGHSWSEWRNQDNYEHYRRCSVCGEREHTDHVLDYTMLTEPKCNAVGYRQAFCTVCEFVSPYYDQIPATNNHIMGAPYFVDIYQHRYNCTTQYCYEGYREDHVFDQEEIIKVATCKEAGQKKTACICGYGSTTVEIPKLSTHSYGAWVSTGANGHERTCTVCGVKETKTHRFGSAKVITPATCTTGAVNEYTCLDCGYKKTETGTALGHSYGPWVYSSKTQHIRTCTRGGEVQTADHRYESGRGTIITQATCTRGAEYGHTCLDCGYYWTDTGAAAGHCWDDGRVTSRPTPNIPGTMTYTCTVCGDHRYEEIPYTGDDGPETDSGIIIVSEPRNAEGEIGSSVSFSVVAEGTGIIYRWQYSIDSGKNWYDCSTGGFNTACFTTTVKQANIGRMYRVVLTDINGRTVCSDPALLSLYVPVSTTKIVTQPASVSAAIGSSVVLKVAASGSGLKYQWQYSLDGGSSWYDCTTGTCRTDSFTINVKNTNYSRVYRVVVSGSDGKSIVSNTVKISPKEGSVISISTQPKSVSVEPGSSVSFTVVAAGTGLSYQWQYSVDKGATWYNCTTGTCRTASFGVTAKSTNNGRMYRVIVSDAQGNSVASNAATLTLRSDLKITAQPKSITLASGAQGSFTVTASGSGLSYRWQYSLDKGVTWYNCSTGSYNTASFTVTAKAANNGRMYRVIVTDATGTTLASSAATLTVK